MRLDEAPDLVDVEHLGEMWRVAGQALPELALHLRLEPAVDGAAEEADLALVDDPVGNETACRTLQHDLRLKPPDLVRARDPRAVLDELVVEKRDTHLERMRHRSPVE